MNLELSDLAARLPRFQKAINKLVDLKEAYEMFDKPKAKKIGEKIAYLTSIVTHYKKEFDNQFSDLKAKGSTFAEIDRTDKYGNIRVFAKDRLVSYRKTSFDTKLKAFMDLMTPLTNLHSIADYSRALNINVKNLDQTNRYAFKAAFYLFREDQTGFESTMNSYNEFKNKQKARNAGKQRNSKRSSNSKFIHETEGVDVDEDTREINEDEL